MSIFQKIDLPFWVNVDFRQMKEGEALVIPKKEIDKDGIFYVLKRAKDQGAQILHFSRDKDVIFYMQKAEDLLGQAMIAFEHKNALTLTDINKITCSSLWPQKKKGAILQKLIEQNKIKKDETNTGGRRKTTYYKINP